MKITWYLISDLGTAMILFKVDKIDIWFTYHYVYHTEMKRQVVKILMLKNQNGWVQSPVSEYSYRLAHAQVTPRNQPVGNAAIIKKIEKFVKNNTTIIFDPLWDGIIP